MRLTWAFLAFLDAANAADTYAAIAGKSCTGAIGCQGYYRAFATTTSPPGSTFGPPSTVTGLSVAAIGAQVAGNASVINARVDVGGFRFKTPADTSDSNSALSFYFGYLGLSGTWDTTTRTGAMVGALAEIVSNLNSLNVYYNNDAQAGFNWNVAAAGQDVLNCATAKTQGYDSLDVNGAIDLKSLIWSTINHTKVQCNSIPALADAPAGCEIHTLSTSGSNATMSANPIVVIDIRIASQPVLINNVRHGPDYAKFDVTVQFPWSYFNSRLYDSANARLALIALHAGKAESFVGAANRNADGTNSLLFTTTTGQTSRYSYTNNATIDGVISPIYTQVITGAQIKALTCTGCSLPTIVVQGALKIFVDWLQGFNWRSSITIHSLGSGASPAKVFWDPEVGAGPSSNSAGFMAPSFVLVAFVAVLFH